MSKKATVTIEICSNCKQHEWCTRHDQALYASLASEISKTLNQLNDNIEVEILKVGDKTRGSFEITCNDVLLFSKKKLGYFPHIVAVSNKVTNFIDDTRKGNDLTKYTESCGSPVKANSGTKSRSGGSGGWMTSGSPKRGKYVPEYRNRSHKSDDVQAENQKKREDKAQQEQKTQQLQQQPQFILQEDKGQQSAPVNNVSVKAAQNEETAKQEAEQSKQVKAVDDKAQQQPQKQQQQDKPQEQKVQDKPEQPQNQAQTTKEEPADSNPPPQQDKPAQQNKEEQSKPAKQKATQQKPQEKAQQTKKDGDEYAEDFEEDKKKQGE